jgi:proline iminopeptidase
MQRIFKWLLVAGGSVIALGASTFVGSYLAYSGQYLVPATTADDPALPSRKLDGYRYHLEVFGMPTRPVVIVVPGGLGGDYRYLLPLKPLSDDYQLVFYDQRGSGLSQRLPGEAASFAQSVEDLHAIALSLSPHDPVRLIGHDYGAMVAAAYLEHYPENVSHAVLAEPPYLTAERGNQWLAAVHEGRPPWSWALARGMWRSRMESLYVYGPDPEARADFYAASLASLDVPGRPFGAYYCGGDAGSGYWPEWRRGARVAQQLERDARGNGGPITLDVVSPHVKRFPHKVLLVASGCNTVMGVAVQRQNLELFAHAELAVIDDAGHSMFGERPDESLTVLRRYFGEDHTAIVASE